MVVVCRNGRWRGIHILNIGSAAGFSRFPEMGSYNLVKAAVISLSETLRVELAPHGIGVTVACPTFFASGLGCTLTYTDETLKQLTDALFSKSKSTADEVARHIVQAVSKNKLYAIPGVDTKAFWFAKRLAPSLYAGKLAKAYAQEGSMIGVLKRLDRK